MVLQIPLTVAADTVTSATVRVAAIQCPSVMGQTAANTSNITALVKEAAGMGAKIVVTPECAVQGYLDPTTWAAWSLTSAGPTAVRNVAEPVPGPTTVLMSRLAEDLQIYLCVGMIETASNGFFNAQILFSPRGTIIAHHRKHSLWPPGDSAWCTPGDRPVQVVGTEFGNLGLMICYDFHVLPPLLARQKADIVLYSVGWYGPNEKIWFSQTFPAKAVIPYGHHVVAANWSSQTTTEEWPGRGHSCIISREGRVLTMSHRVDGNDIVIADLPMIRDSDH